MRIGYPCLNRSIGCTSSRTFRLKSYSPERLMETVSQNLDCLLKTLHHNQEQGFLFFRITSDLVPFASHPICTFDWEKRFSPRLRRIGNFIRRHQLRVSMHPDQFTLINTPSEEILSRSLSELSYHARVLDLMQLNLTAKIQIHVGGVYGEKEKSLKRFAARYRELERTIKRRLVVENDERSYGIRDCLLLHRETGIPVVFDAFHHGILGQGMTLKDGLQAAGKTWKKRDGLPIVDYSIQAPGKRTGSHAETLKPKAFQRFLQATQPLDFDVMLEIKDKEKSARRALQVANKDSRLQTRG